MNDLQELEFKNSVRQKLLRKEIGEGAAAASLRLLQADLVFGILEHKPLAWAAVYRKAEQLSRKLAPRQGCRALDLLHISIAVVSGVKDFATLDLLQAALAEAAGLKVVDLS